MAKKYARKKHKYRKIQRDGTKEEIEDEIVRDTH